MRGLHAEQELFKSLVEGSPMPAAIYTGVPMRVATANAAMLQWWGKDSSVIGKPLIAAVPEFEVQPFADLLRQVSQSGSTQQILEQRADLPVEGQLQTFYLSHTFTPLKITEGTAVAIIHMAADVTEVVQARERIAQAEDHLAFALSSAGIGTWALDPIHQTVQWDAICRQLFGFSGTDPDIPYTVVMQCIHPADQEKVNHAVKEAIAPGTEGNYDIRYRTISQLDGKVRWLRCKGKAYFDTQQVAYRFAGTAQDVTTEVKASLREQQLLSLVNNNVDHMSVADMEGNLTYMNAAARKNLGVAPDEDIAGLRAQDFYTPQELLRVQEHLITQISEDDGWQGVISLMNRKTKEVIPFFVHYILIKDAETGDVIGRGATARDLRPEITAKAELERLATIVDISEDFCNYSAINGNTIYVNPAGLRLIGMDADSVSTSNLFDYHSAASSETIRKVIMPQLLQTGKWTGRLDLIHQQTGEMIPIHKQFFIIRADITNEPIALAGIARDMRPELKAGKALDYKNAQLHIAIKELEFLANSVPVVVWTCRPDGKMDYINQRWYERSDLPIDQALGTGWSELLHPEDEQRSWAVWRESLRSGDPFQVEFRLRDKENLYRWWMVRAIALKDDHGNILKWYGSNIDITDQKELEHQKDNFLGVASHELKTPVTSIKAYAQVLEMMFRRTGDTKNAELLHKMDNQINRLSNLIGDLLEVTKINTGRLQFNAVPFNFSELVMEVVEEVQRTSLTHRIEHNLHFDGLLTGDKERISQVMVNLLTNAIKYSPGADHIIISTEDHGHEVQLSVRDFGIGIRTEVQEKVFEQFYRVSGSRQHTFPGLGLGLYISSEIVKHLNGRIWLSSEEGKGSTFSFVIPLNNT